MVIVKEVKTRKERRQFLNYALRLYKGNPYWAPPLYMDEKKLFRRNYAYYEQSEAVYYLAYRDGKPVGRISGILQRVSNEKWKQKRVRFTRFDCIDDQEVATALLTAVEKWAKEKGMEEVVGPLGFSDFEREGLLIEGFDQLSTYEEQYNYPYYQKLIENCGYGKDVDWVENRLRAPDPETIEKMKTVSAAAMERYGLHFGEAKNTKEFLKKYADAFFEIVDITYNEIYGSVPFPNAMKKEMIANFKLIIDRRFVHVICDKDERVVCFGLCFPAIAKPLQRSGGKLTPITLIKTLRAIKHPKSVDLGLVGVLPEYRLKGISSALFCKVAEELAEGQIEYAETNLTLEYNHNILNQWKNFNATQHKRRRSFVKKLED